MSLQVKVAFRQNNPTEAVALHQEELQRGGEPAKGAVQQVRREETN